MKTLAIELRKEKRTMASSSVMSFASGTMLSKTAPRTIRRWLRVRRSSLDNFCRNIFSRFSNCRIFFFPSSISACSSSRVFSLGFVMAGHSFLPVGIEKGQPISRLSLCNIFCAYFNNLISTSCSAHIVKMVAGSPVYITSTRSPSE